MQWKDKWLTGLRRTFSLVDSTLLQQGFKRCGKEERLTYLLTIQDSATTSSYCLKIPTRIDNESVPGKKLTQIGNPSISKPLQPSKEIPLSIRYAVESKLAEIADYLQSHKK